MPITAYEEDILPEIESQVPVDVAAYLAAQESVVTGESTPGIPRDISGCLSLIGPLQICWDVNLSLPSAAISLKVGPVTVISGEISPQHPCLTFKGSYGVAKWDLNICLRVAQKAITLEGKACAAVLRCKTFHITLFHWGRLADLALDDGDLEDDAELGVDYPAYQCLKDRLNDRLYCTRGKVYQNDAKQWIKACVMGHNLRQGQYRTYLKDSRPPDAIVWP